MHKPRSIAFPRHVAIIMDGNGRWARRRGLPRVFGHRRGADVVTMVTATAARIGLKYLTLYSFSIENWKRPREEVETLMNLYAEYLIRERATMMRNNVRLVQCGRRDGLPPRVLEELDRSIAESAGNDGLTLALALNYGSRMEITDAVKAIARDVAAGRLSPDEITEQTISENLYTPEVPDPDLLIRTSGERRLSNFLLWQISYSEIHVTDVTWPEFTRRHFFNALRDYARRDRRFGNVPTPVRT
ncbi:MAG: Ditrans,polycis-undecaprenyl-diphosphate synthase ((2E,6E)-farnesyl-diphosphate specific) [Phycisphaerae bacterium]|nr:Ditrans,polycis-undecaprenyl-diphosphate synthase ((2E,6E)-farnesyl-diphosphate specific) [Phycisphaerae bacterium]